MFRPQIQKTWVVLFVALFSIMMVYFAMSNITYHKTVGYQDKIEASKIMGLHPKSKSNGSALQGR